MTTIIDGYNLIYKIPSLEEHMYSGNLLKASQNLVHYLNEYSQAVQNKKIKRDPDIDTKFIVVFDGKKQKGLNIEKERVKNVDIIYSHDLSADHIIKQLVKGSINPRSLTVVTSDNEILRYTKKFRVRQKKSEDYANFLQKALAKINEEFTSSPEEDANLELSANEVAYWEDIFKK